jgi:hypothetical protein
MVRNKYVQCTTRLSFSYLPSPKKQSIFFTRNTDYFTDSNYTIGIFKPFLHKKISCWKSQCQIINFLHLLCQWKTRHIWFHFRIFARDGIVALFNLYACSVVVDFCILIVLFVLVSDSFIHKLYIEYTYLFFEYNDERLPFRERLSPLPQKTKHFFHAKHRLFYRF